MAKQETKHGTNPFMVTPPNICLQARPGFAFLFVLPPRPGLPEAKR